MAIFDQVYRVIVPKPIRTRLLLSSLEKAIPAMVEKEAIRDPEIVQVNNYIKENGVRIFPYAFTAKYKEDDIEVFQDATGHRYVVLNGKKLFFKRRWSASRIRKAFSTLQMEQDPESPHRYLSDRFNLSHDDVIADFGAAEGNFSLDMVDKVKKIYLFESDPEWKEALEKTFEPWKEKVEIINKLVSQHDDERHCSGDRFFANREISFLKIDVDGGEEALLEGLKDVIKNKAGLRIALCTYHKHDDERIFTALLEDNNFKVTPTPGYMIFYHDKKLKAPYLRRALIRAEKNR